jgi:hypothetical protein
VLAKLVGDYDFDGEKVAVTAAGKRLYITLAGAPKYRGVPMSEQAFWIEQIQTAAVFEHDDAGKVTRIVFAHGNQRFAAKRIESATAP